MPLLEPRSRTRMSAVSTPRSITHFRENERPRSVGWGEPHAPPSALAKARATKRAFVLQGNVSLNPANGDAWQYTKPPILPMALKPA